MSATAPDCADLVVDVPPITGTTWARYGLTEGAAATWTLPALAEQFAHPPALPPGRNLKARKARLPGWSPACFEGHRRAKDCVIDLCAAVLDLDCDPSAQGPARGDPDLDPDRLAKVVEAVVPGVAYLAHTSPQSDVGAWRWRLILPFSRAVTAEEHGAIVAHLRLHLLPHTPAAEADFASSMDAARLWYWPAVDPDRPHAYRSLYRPGHPLDVDALLGVLPPPPALLKQVEDARRARWPELRPPPVVHVARRTPRSSAAADDIPAAVSAYRADRSPKYPQRPGPCPVDGCWGEASFHALPESPDTWWCFSSHHAGTRVGREAPSGLGWFGDVLDLDAAARGMSRVELLRAEGYLIRRGVRWADCRSVAELPHPWDPAGRWRTDLPPAELAACRALARVGAGTAPWDRVRALTERVAPLDLVRVGESGPVVRAWRPDGTRGGVRPLPVEGGAPWPTWAVLASSSGWSGASRPWIVCGPREWLAVALTAHAAGEAVDVVGVSTVAALAGRALPSDLYAGPGVEGLADVAGRAVARLWREVICAA